MFNLQLAWDRPAKISSQVSEHILRVRLEPSGARSHLPLQLAVAIDTSASMQGEKWERSKAACQALVAQLRPGDRISLAAYADWITPLAHNLQNHQSGDLPAILNALVAEGVTRTDLALNWIRYTLSPEPGRARVGILITDGHPTTEQGEVLDDTGGSIVQAEAIASDGISLCAVGLGNAEDFNSALLVSLSDRGRGTFIYADNPTLLATQLQECLQKVQAIAFTDVTLKIELAGGVKLKNCCQFRPDYLPVLETNPQEIHLRNLRSDTANDVLLALEVPGLNASQIAGSYAIAQVQLQTLESAPVASLAALQFTPSYREAQQINPEIDRDRLCWDINRYSTALTSIDDSMLTGELLSQIHAAAVKSGQTAIADEVSQQLDILHKTGQLSAHQTTGLLRATRQLGG